MRDSFRFYISLALAVAALPVAGTAQAEPISCENWFECVAPGAGGSGHDTTAFLGLRWAFGASGPAVVGGVRYLQSNDDDGVYGAQIDAALPLLGDSHLPKVRLLGLFGSEEVQGQLGGGYDFATETAILSAGLQASHFEAGLDYGLDGNFAPYVGISSLAKPGLGGTSCPADYTLVAVDSNVAEYQSYSVFIDDQYVSSGQTCISGEAPPP